MGELQPEIAAHRDRWQRAFERTKLREALSVAVDLARVGNRAFDAAEPWKSRKDDLPRCGRDLAALLELVRAVAALLTRSGRARERGAHRPRDTHGEPRAGLSRPRA